MPDGRPPQRTDDQGSIAVADQPAAGTQLREDRQRSRTRERIRQGLGGRVPLDSALLGGGTGAPSAVAEAEDTGAEADAAASAGYFASGETAGRLQEARQRSRRRQAAAGDAGDGGSLREQAEARFGTLGGVLLEELARIEQELEERSGLGLSKRARNLWIRGKLNNLAKVAAQRLITRIAIHLGIDAAMATLILIPVALILANTWLWFSKQGNYYNIPTWLRAGILDWVIIILLDVLGVILIILALVFIIIIAWAIVHPFDAFRLLLGSGLKPLWDLVKLGVGAIF